jgi:GH35 family endo-1,4-beta-xylanase
MTSVKAMNFRERQSLFLFLCIAFGALSGPAALAQNLITNPGFETGTNGWSARGTVQLVRTNTMHNGTYALAIAQRGSPTDGVAQSIDGKIEAGVEYFCSAWVRANSPSAQRVVLEFANSDSTNLVAEGSSSNVSWVFLSGVLVAQGTENGALVISGPDAAIDLLVDDVVVVARADLRAANPAIKVGGIVGSSTLGSDALFGRVIGREYDIAGTENALKFGDIHPSSASYSFTAADTIVNAAMANGQNARGHNLVWHQAVPSWITGSGYTAAQLQSALFSHVDTVVGRYKEKLFCWDVVNEAFNDNGTIRSTVWYDTPGIGYAGLGTKYIEEVFKRARAADPDAQLFYNDYSAETVNTKSDAIYAMAKDFKTRGVPLDGIGFQMHIGQSGISASSWRSNLKRFADLGLKLHITEMDVKLVVDTNGIATAADLQTQADVYHSVMGGALVYTNVEVIQTWGFSDKYSWIPGFQPGYGAALPLDKNFNRKPAWWAIHDALVNQAEFLPVLAASPAGGATVTTNSSYSGGRARSLAGTGVNSFLTLRVKVPYSGSYNLRVGFGGNSTGGIVQVGARSDASAPFAPLGRPVDLYSSAFRVFETNIATNDFPSAGVYEFNFAISGKNASSGGYGILLDYIRLTPTGSDGNQSPAFAGLSDTAVTNRAGAWFFPFQISDRETVEDALTLTVASGNTTLIPAAGLAVLGAGQHRVLSLTPNINQVGTASITMIATDAAGNSATNRFNVTVNPPVTPLQIATSADLYELRWPTNSITWRVETSGVLDAPISWRTVSNTPVLSGGTWLVQLSKTDTNGFFRLAH